MFKARLVMALLCLGCFSSAAAVPIVGVATRAVSVQDELGGLDSAFSLATSGVFNNSASAVLGSSGNETLVLATESTDISAGLFSGGGGTLFESPAYQPDGVQASSLFFVQFSLLSVHDFTIFATLESDVSGGDGQSGIVLQSGPSSTVFEQVATGQQLINFAATGVLAAGDYVFQIGSSHAADTQITDLMSGFTHYDFSFALSARDEPPNVPEPLSLVLFLTGLLVTRARAASTAWS